MCNAEILRNNSKRDCLSQLKVLSKVGLRFCGASNVQSLRLFAKHYFPKFGNLDAVGLFQPPPLLSCLFSII